VGGKSGAAVLFFFTLTMTSKQAAPSGFTCTATSAKYGTRAFDALWNAAVEVENSNRKHRAHRLNHTTTATTTYAKPGPVARLVLPPTIVQPAAEQRNKKRRKLIRKQGKVIQQQSLYIQALDQIVRNREVTERLHTAADAQTARTNAALDNLITFAEKNAELIEDPPRPTSPPRQKPVIELS
jgi:hypothetical protein